MNIGFDQPLYLLPFDHRESFETKLFGWKGALSDEHTAEIVSAKRVIYDGFQAAIAGGANFSMERLSSPVPALIGVPCARTTSW